MRLLHFADLHLDTPFCWAPPGVAHDRRRSLRETLRRICAPATEENVHALTCDGARAPELQGPSTRSASMISESSILNVSELS